MAWVWCTKPKTPGCAGLLRSGSCPRRWRRIARFWNVSSAKLRRPQRSIIPTSVPFTTSANWKGSPSKQWSFWKGRHAAGLKKPCPFAQYETNSALRISNRFVRLPARVGDLEIARAMAPSLVRVPDVDVPLPVATFLLPLDNILDADCIARAHEQLRTSDFENFYLRVPRHLLLSAVHSRVPELGWLPAKRP